MLPTHYTPARAGRLERLSVADITEPFLIKVLWLIGLSFETGKKVISTQNHRHSFFEAHFIFSGSMIYEADGKKYNVTGGSGILFSPGHSHTVKFFSDDLIKISLAFLPEAGSAIYSTMSEKGSVFFPISKELNDCFDGILTETDTKGDVCAHLIKNRVFEIICRLARMCGLDESDKRGGEEEDIRIAIVKRFISDNSDIFLTCRDVAEHCHFNTKYLNRIFRQKTGMTLLEYIHAEKLRAAEKLLSEGELSLSEISAALGFANEYYFNSFFKRQSGMPPGLYRKLSNG